MINDAVARTKADPNRSMREDALVAEIERLRAPLTDDMPSYGDIHAALVALERVANRPWNENPSESYALWAAVRALGDLLNKKKLANVP